MHIGGQGTLCGWALEPPRLVSCTQAWEYHLPKKGHYPELNFVAEAFLHGSETQWVNNRGEILIPSSSSDFSMAVEAFAHFSLDASGGKLMVSDLQGVLKPGNGNCRRIHLTDPQILSWDQSFGAADLGPTAMQTFRSPACLQCIMQEASAFLLELRSPGPKDTECPLQCETTPYAASDASSFGTTSTRAWEVTDQEACGKH